MYICDIRDNSYIVACILFESDLPEYDYHELCTHLKTINFPNISLYIPDMLSHSCNIIITILKYNKNVKQLNLVCYSNKINNVSFKKVCKYIKLNNMINKLTIYSYSFTKHNIKWLTNSIRYNLALKDLSIHGLPKDIELQNELTYRLYHILKYNNYLESITLCDELLITPHNAKALAIGLQQNTFIKELTIYSNFTNTVIKSNTIKYIMKGIRNIESLTFKIMLKDKGVKYICKSIRHNKNIKLLFIELQKSTGIKYISSLLKVSHLKSVQIKGSFTKDILIKSIGIIQIYNPYITHFNIKSRGYPKRLLLLEKDEVLERNKHNSLQKYCTLCYLLKN